MNNSINIMIYIFLFLEISLIIFTYYYLTKQYKYAVFCYKRNQHGQKKFAIKKREYIEENIIVSNITADIDVDELNDKISLPILNFRLDGEEIVKIPMNDEKIFIGRGKSDDIVINEPTISRSNCVITKEDDKYFINIDINKNPIKLNKKQISKAKVNPFKQEIYNGDIIFMGNGRISFEFLAQQNLVIV